MRLSAGAGRAKLTGESMKMTLDQVQTSKLVPKEFTGDLEIALLVRMRHAGTVHPLAGPLDRPRQIDWIFNYTRIDQALAIGTQPEAFG